MKFSLIICTYQRPQSLLTLLNALQQQLVYPHEIIVVDGSKNNKTGHVLLNNSFKNLHYFKVNEENRGLTKQRNYGLSKVSKSIEIICFLDDDVIPEPTYFKELINTYTVHPEAIGVGGYITNEVNWKPIDNEVCNNNYYCYDGFKRKEGVRFKFRKRLGLVHNTPPGFMPPFSHGRSVGFLPPSNKIYPVEFFMGGVSSFKKSVFNSINFSTFFEGYGLYEDVDFCLRASKIGSLFVNTSARLKHFHEPLGRPDSFKFGKMVVRNGWYVWRVKYKNPATVNKIKWVLTSVLLACIRLTNVFSNTGTEAFKEAMGRFTGLFSLILKKPR